MNLKKFNEHIKEKRPHIDDIKKYGKVVTDYPFEGYEDGEESGNVTIYDYNDKKYYIIEWDNPTGDREEIIKVEDYIKNNATTINFSDLSSSKGHEDWNAYRIVMAKQGKYPFMLKDDVNDVDDTSVKWRRINNYTPTQINKIIYMKLAEAEHANRLYKEYLKMKNEYDTFIKNRKESNSVTTESKSYNKAPEVGIILYKIDRSKTLDEKDLYFNVKLSDDKHREIKVDYDTWKAFDKGNEIKISYNGGVANVEKHKSITEELKEEEIGDVAIDSGAVVITDPANISDEKRSEYEEKGYADGELSGGVVTKGVGGDGSYKVIARWNDFKDGNIPDEIVIKLNDDNEDE